MIRGIVESLAEDYGRPWLSLVVDGDSVTYQSFNEDNQVDVAIRLRVIIIYWLRWHGFFNCQISANFRYRLN